MLLDQAAATEMLMCRSGCWRQGTWHAARPQGVGQQWCQKVGLVAIAEEEVEAAVKAAAELQEQLATAWLWC